MYRIHYNKVCKYTNKGIKEFIIGMVVIIITGLALSVSITKWIIKTYSGRLDTNSYDVMSYTKDTSDNKIYIFKIKYNINDNTYIGRVSVNYNMYNYIKIKEFENNPTVFKAKEILGILIYNINKPDKIKYLDNINLINTKEE